MRDASMAGEREAALTALRDLLDEVDARARALAARQAAGIRCGPGCTSCCTDGLTVLEVEAELIRRRHAALLEVAAPHPPGACAFLDLEAGTTCRIYADRPYICRTQGLPLRWFDRLESEGEWPADQVAERRDVCPLNLEGLVLEELDAADFWLLGPHEERLALIEALFSAGECRRVELRLLFRS